MALLSKISGKHFLMVCLYNFIYMCIKVYLFVFLCFFMSKCCHVVSWNTPSQEKKGSWEGGLSEDISHLESLWVFPESAVPK